VKTAIALAAVAALIALAGCDVEPLSHEQLFGARSEDASAGTDADPGRADAPIEAPPAGGTDAAGMDAATGPDATAACSSTSCGGSECCDPGSGRCVSAPTALLSGTVWACRQGGVALGALIGYAGVHSCAPTGKGSYGVFVPACTKARFSVYKQHWQRHDEDLTVPAVTGAIKDVVLQPEPPYDCAQNPPPDVPCRCELPGCR
jgi:hypothetical protein